MPKIQPRSATPPTPRQPEDLLRRSSLYGANLKAPFIHKKLCEEVVDDLLVRSSERGIALASSVPAGQQMAERDSGFVRRAKVSVGPERAFYTGTSTTVYSTEPKNLLRFGRSGAKQLQRGRLRGHLRNQEWTPKLLATPVAHSGPISMCSPALWPDEAQYTTGSSVYKKKLAKEHAHPAWFARETSACAPVLAQKPALKSSQNEERDKPWSDANLDAAKGQVVSERLLRTIERERDAEEKFHIATQKSRRAAVGDAEPSLAAPAAAPTLTDGLGPEAKLRVLRRHKHLSSTGGRRGGGGRGANVVPAHERRKPRNCGGLLCVVETRADVDIAAAMRKQGATELAQAALKWQLLGRFHAKWYQGDRNKGPGFSYSPLVTLLAEAAEENADCHVMSRDQFMSCTLLRLRDVNLAHRLYSALDAGQTDKLPWINIVAPLVMLAAAQMGAGQREVLLAGLQLFEAVHPPLTLSSTLAVLTMASGSRLERLEIQSRAHMGFEFSLRAAAAAADLAGDIASHTDGMPRNTPSRERRSRERPAPSKMTPELVLEVLQEYPELADDVNRQLSSSFARAGKAMPSLAVIDADEQSLHGEGRRLQKLRPSGGMSAAGTRRSSRQTSARVEDTRAKIAARQRRHDADAAADDDEEYDDADDGEWAGEEGLRRGILHGDKRKSTVLFPGSTLRSPAARHASAS